MRTVTLRHGLLVILAIGGLGSGSVQALPQDVGAEQELLRTVEAQQQQLAAQQEQLAAQSRLLREIQSQTQSQMESAAREMRRLGDLVEQQQKQLESLQAQAAKPPSDDLVAVTIDEVSEKLVDKIVTAPGEGQVTLGISGHVNRMVSIIDDGEDTDGYFVDNDNSESQVRFVGTAKTTEDLTLGTAIEVSIAPNVSGQVDQRNQETDDVFDQRKVEVTLDSKRYGKIWLGKGFTASYTAGSVDLSGTGVISYSTIVDTAGSMIFRDKDSGEFTDLRIFNAFNSFDGLNRRNRLRYDTPGFGGFQLRTSAVSDSRYDASLWWGGQGYGLKAGAAVAVANPNLDDADLQYNGSFAVLHGDTGLNAAFSFGLLDREKEGDAQNYFGKIGWRKRLFGMGDTALSLDYTRSLNLPTDKDDAYSIGAAAVQYVNKYGAEVFGLYRLHSLDRGSDPEVQDIDVFSLGTRVRF